MKINQLKYIQNIYPLVELAIRRRNCIEWLNKNGWSYHKHQIDTLEEATKGYDILLVAPTGGGKTLAGFMPAITDLIEKKYKDNFLHTLYISPLKALTVDVQRNLAQPINDQSLTTKSSCIKNNITSSSRSR